MNTFYKSIQYLYLEYFFEKVFSIPTLNTFKSIYVQHCYLPIYLPGTVGILFCEGARISVDLFLNLRWLYLLYFVIFTLWMVRH